MTQRKLATSYTREVRKGRKWIVRSHMADKSREKVTLKLRAQWNRIKDPREQRELEQNICRFNAMVMGMHNYYCMATMVSEDFARISYRVVGKSNGMNHNNARPSIEKEGEIPNRVLAKRYGESKQCRWINGRLIVPIGYVTFIYPKYKRTEVNKYSRKSADLKNCVNFEIMKYMTENAYLYPTMEMADNALSRYIAQRGCCAITHQPLEIDDMRCIHIKRMEGERNDTYKNLILLSKDAARIVRSTNPSVIEKLVKKLSPSAEMQKKINTLRKHRELDEIQFEDYAS